VDWGKLEKGISGDSARKEKYDLMHMRLEQMYKKLAIWLKARLALSFFTTLAVWLMLLIMSWFGIDIPNKL